MKPSVLVVEDDVVLNRMLVKALGRAGYEMGSALTWADARRQLDAQAPDVVLLDMNLPDAEDFGPLAEIGHERPTVMLTAYGSIDHAVKAIRMGAVDYLVKPVNLDELELVIRRALDASRLSAGRAVEQAASTITRTPDLLGDSPAMGRLWEMLTAVADSDVTVLVSGESGVGKELVAHAVHRASPRAAERIVAVDCCTLQETLFESELFGHERGAFTGADRRKPGLIEAAAGGTLFLDEIGDIGAALQAKLLRVLETGRFRRVGGTADLRADVRIVAATNRDLPRLVREGQFRADLYYRLSAFVIEVPPLRERLEDIPLLVQHFAARRARNGAALPFSEATLQRMRAYGWPGNVRELRNVVERALLLAAREGRVEPRHLPDFSGGLEAEASIGAVPASLAALLGGEPTLEAIEQHYLSHLLDKYDGNRRRVADVLGVSERTAYRMLDRYGLK
ncbi:sigma-54-dependent transcriptional regulator [Sphaerotilus microaerophilus]|jgi:DNA-binding NtrC family response regulator|uniref:Acetoacetate metabolism regulatory protein AtoC n=1 Tax=Sphaerotilus microaerophilus TaxID=2914710 RepID=A0ABN6PN83_9BURK|nr:sigma-54 dependent transcriptional regulator [Sphaerotilus sp. FB-5]BDI05022.1 acetoacetate metabolism regulatory protein AtoC [Sphaerotilus sp. FB-5]